MCSPSPGTSAPEKTTLHVLCFQNGSFSILNSIHFWKATLSLNIKSVPGVMQFESKRSASGMASPRATISAIVVSASLAERKRRLRCWFILARGATPSMARYSTPLGRAILYRRSVYVKIFSSISRSLNSTNPSSFAWVHMCT